MNATAGAPAWRWKAATLAVLAAGWALSAGLNAPGHLSYDSVIQLLDGRTGRYHTWHPPFMAWLLGLADAAVRGAGLYVAALSATMFGGLALLTAGARRPGPAALIVAALVCASPLVLLWQGIVWKDVLYADLTVAGFAALSAAARAHGTPGRAGGLVGAGVLLTGAALARQDGALALLAAAAAVALEGGGTVGWSRRRRLAVAAAWLAATATVTVGASAALAARSVDGNGAAAQLTVLQAYDLVGVVAHDPAVRLDRLPPDLAADVRRAARAEYSPLHNDALLSDTALNGEIGDAADAVAAQWRETVRRDPLAWAAHRAAVFGQVLFTPDLKACRADFTGVSGPAETMAALRLAPRLTPRDKALLAYGVRLHGTPVYAHAAYALLALALGGWLLARRRPGDVAVAALLGAALAYAGAFLVIGVACDYRYMYPLDLAAMAGALHAAATWRDGPRSRLSQRR